MNPKICSKYGYEDWLLFASGDVSAWRRQAMDRHQAMCLDCAAIRAETDTLFERTHTALRFAPLPPINARIWQEIDANPTAQRQNLPLRRLPLMRGLALGTIGAAALAGGVALFAPGFPGRPAVAFAQVEKAMGEIKTVTWEDSYTNAPTFYADGRVETDSPKRPAVSWARFSPATVAEVGGPPGERWFRDVSLDNVRYQICYTPGQPLAYSYFPNGGICGERGGSSAGSAQERLRDIIIFRLPKDDGEAGDGANNAGTQRKPWVSAEDALQGRRVIRFTQDVVFPGGERGGGKMRWRGTGRKRVVWVDPESHLIVQRDVHTFFSDGKRQIEMTDQRKNFRYNLTPPDGVFDYRPAVGTRYSFVPLPERPATDAEQKGVETAVRRAFNAWNRRDASVYAGAWDFDHTSVNLEAREKNRREQLNYMTSGVPFRTWRIVKIMKASSRIDGLFLSRTAEDKFPPTQPSEFRTFAQVMGTDNKGRIREEWVNVNLRRDGDDYRLVRVYWEWILKRQK